MKQSQTKQRMIKNYRTDASFFSFYLRKTHAKHVQIRMQKTVKTQLQTQSTWKSYTMRNSVVCACLRQTGARELLHQLPVIILPQGSEARHQWRMKTKTKTGQRWYKIKSLKKDRVKPVTLDEVFRLFLHFPFIRKASSNAKLLYFGQCW